MANLTCILAARAAQAGWDVRRHGVAGGPRLCVYASPETHTWIQKAADLAGLGTDAIHWIDGPQASPGISYMPFTGGTKMRAISHFSSLAPRERSVLARSIPCRN